MSAPPIKFGMLRNGSRLRPALGTVLAVAAYMPCALAEEVGRVFIYTGPRSNRSSP